MNHEFPDIQAGFGEGRGIRDQLVNIHWIIEKAREFQNNIYFCFIDYSENEFVQSCLTLCAPMNCSLSGSSIRHWDFPGKSKGVGCHFLLQGDLSNPGDQTQVSHIIGMRFYRLSHQGSQKDSTKPCLTVATLRSVTCQAPLSMGFSRQEYWSGLPILSPGNFPDPGIEPTSPVLQVDSLPTELC